MDWHAGGGVLPFVSPSSLSENRHERSKAGLSFGGDGFEGMPQSLSKDGFCFSLFVASLLCARMMVASC